jgi:hypothetical protein
MTMTTTRLLDYLVSAAREASRPTLIVRTQNEGGTIRIDDELSMLPEDARDALKADDIAIIEFKYDGDLERVYELVQQKPDLESSCLHMRVDFVPTAGRPKSWNTPRW